MDTSDIRKRLQHGQTTFPGVDVMNLVGEIDRLMPYKAHSAALEKRITSALEILDPIPDEKD